MTENEPQNNFWINKKVKLFILKEGRELIFTAVILEYDDMHITFKDREGLVYSFNRDLVQEIKEVQQ